MHLKQATVHARPILGYIIVDIETISTKTHKISSSHLPPTPFYLVIFPPEFSSVSDGHSFAEFYYPSLLRSKKYI